MLDLRIISICFCLFSIPFIFNYWATDAVAQESFHTSDELKFWGSMVDTLPGGYNGLFAGSGECKNCHGFDTAMIASVDPLGNDINVVDDWKATMMANSAKDPFWRAKVSHEVLLYPDHKMDIETKCTSCHAPLGHFAAMHAGFEHYSIDSLVLDPLAKDGVSCLACHQHSKTGLGFAHSGNLNFDTAKVAYGPFISPLESPMVMATDYKPVYSPHISSAGLCAGCHTLITETIDYNSNLTGNTFVEQATYHEWLNSRYEVEEISCQGCHMPALTKGEFYLVNDIDIDSRDTFYLHELVGANTTMLKLLKENIAALDLTASPENFDEVIAKTEDMLRNRSINFELNFLEQTADSLFFEVIILNKAGHKFPSGYPARRAFVEFVLQNQNGDTLFVSGNVDDNYELMAQNNTYEPHYQIINSEDQAQIYELVFGDVNDNVTTVLVRGDHAIKDNRLPPQGFTTEHMVYDTTLIAGNALSDPDFNKENGIQGTGADRIYYHIAHPQFDGMLTATAKMFYQSTPPKWMKEMFDETTPEIETFRTMFAKADRTPFLMKEASVDIDLMVANEALEIVNDIHIYSNQIGYLQIELAQKARLTLFDANGRLLFDQNLSSGSHSISTGISNSIILAYLKSNKNTFTEKVWIK